jgi:hypothetical protein
MGFVFAVMQVVPQAEAFTSFNFEGGSVGVAFPAGTAFRTDERLSKAQGHDLVFLGFQNLHEIANDTDAFILP